MTVNPENTTVGFIGLGIMGVSMAGHLRTAGYALKVYNRTQSKAEGLIAAGAEWCDSPGAVAAACDVVITMVGYPSDVEAVYLGAGGIIERAKPGALLIDMTTSSPALAERLAKAGAARGLRVLDAPVSGGDVGARNATLAIMVGGEEADYQAALPLFHIMGKAMDRLGGPGAGQHTKMVNQIVISTTIMGVAEAMNYAVQAGLNPQQVLGLIGQGAAGGFQLNVLGKRMADGDYAPGFFVHHFLKDMGLALEEAERLGLDLRGLALARAQYDRLAATDGGRDMGTQGLFTLYAQKS